MAQSHVFVISDSAAEQHPSMAPLLAFRRAHLGIVNAVQAAVQHTFHDRPSVDPSCDPSWERS